MSDTRERLLRAAEQLFATQGIDGVSIRDINRCAGQRNTSAVRYHFTDKRGLLAALIESRMTELDAARARALAQVEAGERDVQTWVGVLVRPLLERTRVDEAWAYWVRVLAQLLSVRGQEHRELWEGKLDGNVREVIARIRPLLPGLGDALWRQRVDDLMLLCIGSIRERSCLHEEAVGAPRLDDATFESNLLAVATAILEAPAPR